MPTEHPPSLLPPTLDAVEAAVKRLAGVAVRTPLLESPVLNARLGGRVLLKAEALQRTGSFKFRGAWNRISQLDPAAVPAGVVAYSSGNHAQAVAAAAARRGLPATIVMPLDSPPLKIAHTRAHGAEIVLYDRETANREATAIAICDCTGAVLVPPFEDPHVIAGQATVGLELAAQAADLDAALDDVLVCCSGGGLIAGVALALEARSPGTRVWAVEPDEFDDTARSLASGQRERNARAGGGLCDALLVPTPGELTFSINQRLLAGALLVSDAEVREAMRFAFEHLKLVVEPGGAAALAAVLAGRLPVAGRTVGVVVSGGNVDPALFAEVLAEGPRVG
ncbi:MAG: threonine/serine dehydratase [Candidatus Sericytochromatia bacterium]|nr:threonine/serine dehydratase [Candidatus Sericytochromatia bacterium]